MARKPCAEPGCPNITHLTRCIEHMREADQARGTRADRGYGPAHTKLRDVYIKHLEAGYALTCWRCGQRITQADDMHLGHDDTDRTAYRGPEHVTCNLSAAGKWQRP